MEVITDFLGNYPDDPIRHLHLNEYLTKGNGRFFYGLGDKPFNLSDKNFYLDLELPIVTNMDNALNYHHYCYKAINLCPYTTGWLNWLTQSKKFHWSFFPIDERYFPQTFDKQYGAVYSGQVNSKQISDYLEVMSKFNYRHVGYGGDRVTDKGVSYEKKLDIISKSKITVVHNLLFTNEISKAQFKFLPRWQDNHAFSELDSLGIVPQLKSRLFEGFIGKTVVLCQRDSWNLASVFFREGEHFLYFDTVADLEEKIHEILNDYDKYKKIASAGCDYCKENYSTKVWVEWFYKMVYKND